MSETWPNTCIFLALALMLQSQSPPFVAFANYMEDAHAQCNTTAIVASGPVLDVRSRSFTRVFSLSPFRVVVAGLQMDFRVQRTNRQWVPMYAFSDLCVLPSLSNTYVYGGETGWRRYYFFSCLRSGSTFNSKVRTRQMVLIRVLVHVQVKYAMTCLRVVWRDAPGFSPVAFVPAGTLFGAVSVQ